jgi:hypothetical protein
MRITVIILSVLAALLIVDHLTVPVRLTMMTSWDVQTREVVACVGFFAAWAVATALVYGQPGVAVWGFAGTGLIGLVSGVTIPYPGLVLWGSIAYGFALLAHLARHEQRVADQRARHREQQELAVFLALRSLQETVPELLTRVPDGVADDGPYLHALEPVPPDPVAARTVRR